ncbi:MAG: ATP-binding protein [Lachnospiraceae bacterium]|nr:ATP-binding protein [Lachnospiraceae bacterium]
MFEIANTYEGTIEFTRGGLPVSNRDGHGIGMHSIMAFAEKHNAVCCFRAEGGWFKVQIAL